MKRNRCEGNKTTALFYFTRQGLSASYKCKCGVSREQQEGSGWSNLMQHILIAHPRHQEEVQQKQSVLCFYSEKTRKIFNWISWILSCNLPFNIVANDHFRKHSNLSPISLNSCMKYIKLLTKSLEIEISKMLPPKFALVFDGWSLDGTSTHFIAVIAKWMSPTNKKPCSALLAFSPLLDESNQTAQNHKEFLEYVLQDIFSKDFENVLCLIGDNCSTNKALADLCEKPLIGCSAHRFNLAIQKFLKPHDKLLDKVFA